MESGRSSASSDSTEMQPKMEQGSPILLNGHFEGSPFGDSEMGDQPSLEIVEQPQARGFRFRYECEGPSHGGLQGERSMRNRKTYPVIKVHNYNGNARIVVTLVTDETVPRPHAHKLVGKHCSSGVCIVNLKSGQREIQFPNLCVQHITRKKAGDVLAHRIMDAMLLDRKIHSGDFNNKQELTGEEIKHAKSEAEMQSKTMQLNVVRLCFQAYLQDNQGQITQVLPSQISNPIFDSKAPGANALKICRMDKYGGCCSGGEEVFLLCEKVQKDDIQVRFVEQNDRGEVIWEAFGVFGPHDVHRQYAIVFKTPPYKDTQIEKPVNVLIMLQRKTDTEASDPKSFTFYPQSHDKEDINRKRKKTLPSYPPGGGFGNMDHPNDIFGNRDDSSNGNGTNGQFMNGPQGNGTLPDFVNLPTMAGHKNPRKLFHENAQRTLQSATFMHNGMRPSDNVFNPQPFQIKQETGLEFTSQYGGHINQFQNNGSSEILPGLTHPIKINPASPPQNMATSSDLSTIMVTEPCMMSSQQQTMHSPGYVNGGHSPQHQTGYVHATSPHNAASPHMNTGSPLMVGSSGVDTFQVSQAGYQPAQMTGMNPGQIAAPTNTSQASFSATEMSGVNQAQSMLTQPVQVEEVSSLEMDADLVQTILEQLNQTAQFVPDVNPSNFNFGGNVASQNNDFGGFGGSYNNYFGNPQPYYLQNRGANTCGLQSRNATGGMLEQIEESSFGLDFVDGHGPVGKAGFDEVDSAVVDKFDLKESHEVVSPLIGKAQSEHSYAKTLQVVPCLETDRELRKEKEETLAKKPVTQEETNKQLTQKETPVVDESEHSRVSTVTQETQHELKDRSGAAVQADVKPANPTALKDMESMLKTVRQTSQALQYYAASGDIRYLLMVQRYLMLVQDINGDLPLHTALINEKYEVFQNLLDVMVTLPDAQKRINAFNYNYQTPLHLAVLTNQPGAIILLIRAGADPTLVDRNGCTPAHLAVNYGKNQCLAALLHYLRKGCCMEEPFRELNIRSYDGYTPAHLAAQTENLVAMKLLVHGKADINMADGKSGKTPLHHVVEVDELSIAAYLILQAGANVNMKRFDGNTPLHVACGRESVGMVALLMAGGADPNTENDDVEFYDDYDSDEISGDSDNSDTNTETDGINGSLEVPQRSGEEIIERSEVNGDAEISEGLKDKQESESEESDEEEKRENRTGFHGLTPADFVGSNEKILRILNGEPYISIREIDSGDEDRSLEQTTSVLSSLRLTSKESGIGSMGFHSKGGDMEKIAYDTRINLSKLLDPCKTGCDWQALADKLGLKKMMEGQIGDHSPTRLLLTYFEACGGTVTSLTNALSDMKRADAINILTSVEPDSHSLDKDIPKDHTHDSGLESLQKSKSPVTT